VRWARAMGACRFTERDGKETPGFSALLAGVRFVWSRKLLLAVMSLDLFAVLLGGAVYLLPIFAKDILHVGATGFGWLRAAPSIGAMTMALVLAHRPPMKRAGRSLLIAGIGARLVALLEPHITTRQSSEYKTRSPNAISRAPHRTHPGGGADRGGTLRQPKTVRCMRSTFNEWAFLFVKCAGNSESNRAAPANL